MVDLPDPPKEADADPILLEVWRMCCKVDPKERPTFSQLKMLIWQRRSKRDGDRQQGQARPGT